MAAPGIMTTAADLWRRVAPDRLRRQVARQAQAWRARAIGRRRRGRAVRGPVRTVEIVGLLSQIIGVGEGARLAADALCEAGYAVVRTDVSPVFGRQPELAVEAGASGPPDVTIFHLNGPELLHLATTLGAAPFQAARTIGYWAWELEVLPADWAPAFHLLDEVWCPSEFTASAVRARAPARMAVKVVAHPVHELPCRPGQRARFGLEPESVVVLTSFDVGSTFARKNPNDALEAFRLATDGGTVDSLMLCKVVGGHRAPAALAALEAGLPDNVRLLRAALTDDEMSALISSADIVLSLHRSEGFGLLLARGMLAAKPVVATGWSGNMDFMDAGSAALVPYDLTPARDPQGIYRGGRWARPDVAAAARALRLLIEDTAARVALGERAGAAAARLFDRDAYSRVLRSALDREA